MNKYGLLFHHFGLAVQIRDKAEKFARGLGYIVSEAVFDPEQKVLLSWCHSDTMPSLEIISQAEEKGPLENVLKHNSEMIYHVAYSSTKSIEESLAAMKNDGFRVLTISNPKPAKLFCNSFVSFYYINQFGVIEIIDKTNFRQ